MGPLTTGTMNFTFEAAAPDWTKIPSDELLSKHFLIQE
jgi:hypothetical protein